MDKDDDEGELMARDLVQKTNAEPEMGGGRWLRLDQGDAVRQTSPRWMMYLDGYGETGRE